ncbi:MAG: hypothetical protein NC548_07730 [Lachnospiraceae bacterium]|nr:hypothetical protein [Lachnospiraceae bacterium]
MLTQKDIVSTSESSVRQSARKHGTMSAKGRVKYPKKQMPCLHEQMLIRESDERSEPEKSLIFRVSARNMQ